MMRGSRGRWLGRLLVAVGDGGVAAACWYGALLLRINLPVPFTRYLLPEDRLSLGLTTVPFVIGVQALVLYFVGLYDPEPRTVAVAVRRILVAATAQILLLGTAFFLLELPFPRSVLLLYAGIDAGALAVWRAVADRAAPPATRRIAIVGTGSTARELAEEIRRGGSWQGIEIVGHLVTPEDDRDTTAGNDLGPLLGSISDVPRLLEARAFDDLVLAPESRSWRSELVGCVAERPKGRPGLYLLPGPFESLMARMRYRWIRDIPLVEVVRPDEWTIRHPSKRAFDLVAGSLLLVAASPLMALCAMAVKLGSPGPILYRQTRIGRNGRPFTLLKFRTMRIGSESHEEILAVPGDPRLAPGASFLRRSRLDELPQLLNVLAGQMSLVGPRPERPGFVRRFVDEVPGYSERFSVVPGLTGLAQVHGDYDSSPENKVRYDLAYIANWNLLLDLWILLRTVKIVLTSRGV